jgi:ATP-binding cassette, subfamily B, bacterial MsbA
MSENLTAALPASTTVKILAAVVRDRWWALPCMVLLGLLAALSEGLGIGILIPLFATMFGTAEQPDRLTSLVSRLGGGMDEQERVLLLTAIVLLLVVLRAAIQYTYEALSIWVSGQLIHRLHQALFRQLLDVSYEFFATKDSGSLFEILRGKTWLVSEVVALVSRALISLCTIAVFTMLLMLISPVLTLSAAAGAIAVALLVHLVTRRMRRIGDEAVSAGANLSGRAIQALSNMRVVRLFGQEDREHACFTVASERDRMAVQRLGLIGAAIQPGTELAYVPLFLGILLGAWQGGIVLPTLIAFLVLLYRLQPHARRLDHIRVEIAGMLPMVEQVAGLLRRDDKPYIVSGQQSFDAFQQSIRFEHVGFSYGTASGDRKPALNDVSFEIVKNRVTAFVGESGAGKSTILHLLFRLYDPTSGVIQVDGTPLTRLNLSAWRSRLAFAGQDADLIGDTIFDAIAYGCPTADRAMVEDVSRRAHAEEFIKALPLGYDTPIGDRGTQLSAGQRQRIGLARALLRKPDVLVLDEATSALDSVSESFFQEALAELTGNITVIIVAHRLSTIKDADHVIVLNSGRMVEQGRPHDLLQRPEGSLMRLWQVQTGAFFAGARSNEMMTPKIRDIAAEAVS